jgi:hypothetical protein
MIKEKKVGKGWGKMRIMKKILSKNEISLTTV